MHLLLKTASWLTTVLVHWMTNLPRYCSARARSIAASEKSKTRSEDDAVAGERSYLTPGDEFLQKLNNCAMRFSISERIVSLRSRTPATTEAHGRKVTANKPEERRRCDRSRSLTWICTLVLIFQQVKGSYSVSLDSHQLVSRSSTWKRIKGPLGAANGRGIIVCDDGCTVKMKAGISLTDESHLTVLRQCQTTGTFHKIYSDKSFDQAYNHSCMINRDADGGLVLGIQNVSSFYAGCYQLIDGRLTSSPKYRRYTTSLVVITDPSCRLIDRNVVCVIDVFVSESLNFTIEAGGVPVSHSEMVVKRTTTFSERFSEKFSVGVAAPTDQQLVFRMVIHFNTGYSFEKVMNATDVYKRTSLGATNDTSHTRNPEETIAVLTAIIIGCVAGIAAAGAIGVAGFWVLHKRRSLRIGKDWPCTHERGGSAELQPATESSSCPHGEETDDNGPS